MPALPRRAPLMRHEPFSRWGALRLLGQAAWLLAQHADADPPFQQQCLELLAAAAQAGDAGRRHLAYLTDRVLLARDGRQVHGTQLTRQDGKLAPASGSLLV